MFLPKNHFKEGAGFTNLEYGLMAEYLGKSRVASEVGGHHPPALPISFHRVLRLCYNGNIFVFLSGS
jgi:hypothetical protein